MLNTVIDNLTPFFSIVRHLLRQLGEEEPLQLWGGGMLLILGSCALALFVWVFSGPRKSQSSSTPPPSKSRGKTTFSVVILLAIITGLFMIAADNDDLHAAYVVDDTSKPAG